MSNANERILTDAHSLPPSKSQVFFGPEGRYTRMSSSLLSATVRRLLLDRIEATIYCWTVSGDSKNAAMHAQVAAFPYLDVTKISIRQPRLNFAVYIVVTCSLAGFASSMCSWWHWFYHTNVEYHCTFLYQWTWNVANARYHSLLAWRRYFISGFQLFALVVQATNTGARSHGFEARGRSHTKRGTCVQQLYGPVQKGCATVWTSSTSTFRTTNK